MSKKIEEIIKLYNQVKKDLELTVDINHQVRNLLEENDNFDKDYQDLLEETSYFKILEESELILDNKLYKTLLNGDINKQIKNNKKNYIALDDIHYSFHETIEHLIKESNLSLENLKNYQPGVRYSQNDTLRLSKCYLSKSHLITGSPHGYSREEVKKMREIYNNIRNPEYLKDTGQYSSFIVVEISQEHIDSEEKRLKVIKEICSDSNLNEIISVLLLNVNNLKKIREELNCLINLINNKDSLIEDETDLYQEYSSLVYNMRNEN